MGDYWVFTKAMFCNLASDLIVPPPTSQHTLSLGVKHSPETACLPFKLTLGSMIEALELGADTIIMLGNYGPCRFGYYHKLQETILRDLGYHFQMITESLGFKRMATSVIKGTPLPQAISGMIFSLAKLKTLDELPSTVNKIRAMERNKGEATLIYRDALKALDEAANYRALRKTKREYLRKLNSVPTEPSPEVLKIGITGELYVVLEPFANMEIEIELGKLGVEVRRPISLWEFVHNFSPLVFIFGLGEKDRSHRAARPYLSRHIGGDGWQSVGEKVLHARDWDGLVHLEPFGCLPETMARNIMPATKEDLPVLNIIYDEHTGKAGIISRLEAFVDMIRSRKRRMATR
jgi:predicted nucleotide-binding protein (sugar kinase/HSP70/actin superfamily)